jgi:hypothetical protein
LRMRVRKSATGSVRFIVFLSSPVRSGRQENLRECLWRQSADLVFLPRTLAAVDLPAGLYNSRNLTLKRQPTEAQTADAKLAQKRSWAAAELAAVMLAGLELRLTCVFDALCCGCHKSSTLSIVVAKT